MRKIFLLYYLILTFLPSQTNIRETHVISYFGFDFRHRPMLKSWYNKYPEQRESFPQNQLKKS